MKTEHIVVALAENKPGVISKISGLFRRRGFNIQSITAGHTEEKGISRLTIMVDGTKTNTEQLIKQLYKIIEITKVSDLTLDKKIVRELALVKLYATKSTRSEIMQIVDIFKARIVDVSHSSVIVEITGDSLKIESFLDLVRGFGIKEIARTGVTAMNRGEG
ncbi:acetolactate synthase small subunit [Candidatus Peregrinibacteria bacterium RIFOXYA12_FULL_33_12]|nr:MAG: acetolactate synthase small subunit [Candidatus Peregrinibacteria bacterium RIFOXYA12_FULL_33_12]OGJ45159.1 MAG: acetolactate synthase small subunit [Candidatus Peregrinibacteria bacterium RIFOXYA2_FULL_33_21]OGJ50828.1 MAG: acetolactate synthase small subunit [Candidatus Peregrinibacteria bacterium RIFOXYB2_FULL_33_20]